jgi:hypothetical protein
MRHPKANKFFIWALPSLFGGMGTCLLIFLAAAEVYPRVAKWGEVEFDKWSPTLSSWIFIASCLLFGAAYLAVLIYTGTGESQEIEGRDEPELYPKPTGLSHLFLEADKRAATAALVERNAIDREFLSSKSEDINWAAGLSQISAQNAACAFANVTPEEYDQSARAQVIYNEIKAAADLGWLPTGEEYENSLMRLPNGLTLGWRNPAGGPKFEKKEVDGQTMLTVKHLSEHFSNHAFFHNFERNINGKDGGQDDE